MLVRQLQLTHQHFCLSFHRCIWLRYYNKLWSLSIFEIYSFVEGQSEEYAD